MTARYSIYFAPADDSQLADFGQKVLCRSALDHQADKQSHPSPDWMELVKSPRHYGFHATLKAPFELIGGSTETNLCNAVEKFSSDCSTIVMDGLRPSQKHNFLALLFTEQPVAIRALAERCVVLFEKFRAPLSAQDIERRRPETLSRRQRRYLEQWGYPYVFDDFIFHMTLSSQLGSTTPESKQQFAEWLDSTYRECVTDTPCLDRLAIYRQPDRRTPFVRMAEFVFAER